MDTIICLNDGVYATITLRDQECKNNELCFTAPKCYFKRSIVNLLGYIPKKMGIVISFQEIKNFARSEFEPYIKNL